MRTKKRIDSNAKLGTRSASITMVADILEIDMDPEALSKAVAEATAKALTNDIRTFGERAAESTIKRRKAKGITSEKRWLATGKLAGDIRAEKSGGNYVVTAPGDRLPSIPAQNRFKRDMRTLRGDATKNPLIEAAFREAAIKMVSVKKGHR
jgi:hypothetical protein